MSVDADIPELPLPPDVEAEPAKPARRRRTPKAEVSAEAEVVAPTEADAPAAPRPARKRRAPSVVAAEPDPSPVAGGGADGEVSAASPTLAEVRPEPAAEPVPTATRASTPSEALPVSAGDPGADTAADANADTGNTEPEEPGAGGGRNRRRRNRRDRAEREARGAEPGDAGAPPREAVSAEADGDDEDDEAGGESAMPRPVPTDPAEVFAQVLSGEFDAGGEELPEPPPPHKRVLLPEPDAPKLQKVLAQSGIGSRRDMEALIQDGQVSVNGEPAHIGQRISFGDRIAVRGKPIRVRIVPPPPRIIAYHKPVGEVVTHDDPQQRPTVFRRLPRLPHGKWQSVGRLDLNTEGLLLFTNSGELANQLMHPRFGVEREYAVRVLGKLDDIDRAQLLEGVNIDGQTCSFRSIEDGGGEGANHWYRVVITEGRNREVRKLFDAVELTVSRLIRIRYGTVVLPRGLKRGVWVDLDAADVRAIRQLAGGPKPERPQAQGGGQQAKPGRNKPQPPRDRPGNDRPRNGPGRPVPAPRVQSDPPVEDRERDRYGDLDDDFDPSRIPNPLEQTFDKRFVQNPRMPAGGRGFGRGGGGFGAGGSAPPPAQRKPGSPREPDPLQTSVGYIGGDAYRKARGGGGGGGGGNRGGFGGNSRGGGKRGR
jgi:23S rRNA pseudouridine2605 synthase